MPEILTSRNIRTMKTMLELGAGSRVDHIALRSGLSLQTVYRSLETLIGSGVASKRGTTYSLHGDENFVEEFAHLVDSEKILLLDKGVSREALRFRDRAIDTMGKSLTSLVLFGSMARGRAKPESDADIMLIHSGRSTRAYDIASPWEKASLTIISEEEFREKWFEGNDLVRSAASWGISLHDPRGFLYEYRVSTRVPITEKSIVMAGKSLENAWEQFLENARKGNWTAAAAYKNSVASITGRMILMELGVFPRTRWEVPEQLDRLNLSIGKELRAIGGLSNEDIARDFERTTGHLEDIVGYHKALVSGGRTIASLRAIFWGTGVEAQRGVSASLRAAGFECEEEVAIDDGTHIDIVVAVEGERIPLEVKTTTKPADEKLLMRTTLENVTLVYNPYREIPPDDRSYEIKGKGVEEEAARRGLKLVPSVRLFGDICEVLTGREGKPTVLETLRSRH